MVKSNKVDTTFLTRKKIIAELEKLSHTPYITDKDIELWKNKWVKKDKILFLNTLLFVAQNLAFPLVNEKKKGWIITRILELLNDPKIPQIILKYLKKIKISIPILIVMEPVFEYYNAYDKIDEFIEQIPRSKTLEAGKNVAKLLLDGRTQSRFEFLVFLNEFTFGDINDSIKVLKNLSALKDVNLLNLYEFLIESNQKPLIKSIIKFTEPIKHPESVLFLDKVIKRFKNDPEISQLAQDIKKKILESPELGKDKSVRAKIVLKPLVPFDNIYITPIQDNFTFSLHFLNYKKCVYIILYCDLIVGIANFELLENVSKKQIEEFFKFKSEQNILLPINQEYAIKIIEDAYKTSIELNTTPYFFIGLKKLLSRKNITPKRYRINWKSITKHIELYAKTEKPKRLFQMNREELNKKIEEILSSEYTQNWYYFTKLAKEMYHTIINTIQRKKNGEIDINECKDKIFDIYVTFVNKYLLPDIELWALSIQRTIALMINQLEFEKAFYLYELTFNFVKEYQSYNKLSDVEAIMKLLKERFFIGIIKRSIYISGMASKEEEEYFEDYLFEESDKFNDFDQ